MCHFRWERRETVPSKHAFLKAIALANAGRKRRNLVICENKPAKLSGKCSFGNRGHAIALERNHFEGTTLCEFFWKDGEIAVREKSNFELVETADVFWES
jgi:hypothetical protein